MIQTVLVGSTVRDLLPSLLCRDRGRVVVGSTPDKMLALGFLQVGRDFPVFLHSEAREEHAPARTGHGGVGPYVTLDEHLRHDRPRGPDHPPCRRQSACRYAAHPAGRQVRGFSLDRHRPRDSDRNRAPVCRRSLGDRRARACLGRTKKALRMARFAVGQTHARYRLPGTQ